ncbi:uncharacterized protein LOC107271658 isoform X2 [Cephus cinctus]|uniref:Uncharacterized protein LOC107271658 isoform X2 n=1 Tax=Cephus cinctus TaxID=211228 RepID=A0AAJ7W5H5_CEPCN|nr:uncharacterized protein LOC107271658 isoform X2 [Cephus cinctus]
MHLPSPVRSLVQAWSPLVWLAPGEEFLPLGVPEFLENVHAGDNYLRTRESVELLLQNRSSFLYGRKPAGTVPIYALVKSCTALGRFSKAIRSGWSRTNSVRSEDLNILTGVQNNDLLSKESSMDSYEEDNFIFDKRRYRKLHFHVTYWMFYPFSKGKAVCVLDLGFFGSWPIPLVGGKCMGRFKEYGNHVGDWEHMSLYFKTDDYPMAMYVSAHDAGAFYRYDRHSKTFIYEGQETRKGIFQKPIFPERVFTSAGSHPVLFSAKGSHGLWTAPGKHKFVRIPRLYDESGFGTAWPTWQNVEVLHAEDRNPLPGWMTFRGKWGNPKSNCHPLAKLGFNICEFVDGPTGIPMKKLNFQC